MRSRFCSLWAPSGLFITARTCTCTCTRTVQPYTVTLFRTKVRKYESTFVPSKVSTVSTFVSSKIFSYLKIVLYSTCSCILSKVLPEVLKQSISKVLSYYMYSTLNVYTYVYYLRTKVHLYNNPTTTLSTVQLFITCTTLYLRTVVVRVQLYTINVYEGTKVRKYFRKYFRT